MSKFSFTEGYYKAISTLDPETQLRAFKVITEYGLYGIEGDTTGFEGIFYVIKESIDNEQKSKKEWTDHEFSTQKKIRGRR